jgi:hypothetical protein
MNKYKINSDQVKALLANPSALIWLMQGQNLNMFWDIFINITSCLLDLSHEETVKLCRAVKTYQEDVKLFCRFEKEYKKNCNLPSFSFKFFKEDRMKIKLEKGEVTSINEIKEYAQGNPDSLTAKTLMEILPKKELRIEDFYTL